MRTDLKIIPQIFVSITELMLLLLYNDSALRVLISLPARTVCMSATQQKRREDATQTEKLKRDEEGKCEELTGIRWRKCHKSGVSDPVRFLFSLITLL